MGCYKEYNINDRTFPHKNRHDKPYLEIHHIIALANNRKKLDVEFNLSKLCPVCHTSLKQNRTTEPHQKSVIQSILEHDSTDTESLKMYLETKNTMDTIHKIYEYLK